MSETFSYMIKNYVIKHVSTINGVHTVRKDILKRLNQDHDENNQIKFFRLVNKLSSSRAFPYLISNLALVR